MTCEVKILRQLPLVTHGVMVMVLGFMVLGVMILGPWYTVRRPWFMGSWVHGFIDSWYEEPIVGPNEERE